MIHWELYAFRPTPAHQEPRQKKKVAIRSSTVRNKGWNL